MSKLKIKGKLFDTETDKSLEFMSFAPTSHVEIFYKLSKIGTSPGSVFLEDPITTFVKDLENSLS